MAPTLTVCGRRVDAGPAELWRNKCGAYTERPWSRIFISLQNTTRRLKRKKPFELVRR
jgi:hypothetical protein